MPKIEEKTPKSSSRTMEDWLVWSVNSNTNIYIPFANGFVLVLFFRIIVDVSKKEKKKRKEMFLETSLFYFFKI